MNGPLLVTQFLHIAGGAAWLGGLLFANLVIVPFIAAQPWEHQRALVHGIVLGPERVMIGAALVAAVTGLIRGVVFGPITSLDALVSPYGFVWVGAITTTITVFAVGGMVTSPAARRLRVQDALWTDDEGTAAVRLAAIRRLRLGFRAELTGILLIVALMVLLPSAPR